MDSRSSVFYLGIPLGTWFQTQVRVSLLFFLLVAICAARLGANVGLSVSAILFLSVLIHEFFHVAAARATGGDGDEILIWPLGGLAYTRPGPALSSEFLTAGAGPLSNLLLFTGALALLTASGFPVQREIFSLLTLPPVTMTDKVFHDALVLTASINFKLMCVNLLPAIPLDGGHMALSTARALWPGPNARLRTLQVGQGVSLLLAFFGLLMEDSFPILLAFLLMAYNLHDFFLVLIAEQLDDPALAHGYAEYAPAERDAEKPLGPIARWRQKRHEERRQREESERVENEQRLDALLDKVHREGMNSLSEAERRFLNRASTRYRSQEH